MAGYGGDLSLRLVFMKQFDVVMVTTRYLELVVQGIHEKGTLSEDTPQKCCLYLPTDNKKLSRVTNRTQSQITQCVIHVDIYGLLVQIKSKV